MYSKSMMLLIMAAIFPLKSFSQILKNQWVFNGAISAQYNKNSDVFEINTPISAGYFIFNKCAVGLQAFYGYRKGYTYNFGYDYSLGVIPFPYSEKSNQYALSLFSRYYIMPASNKFNIFIEGAYGYGKNTIDSDRLIFDETINITVFSATISPVYFINKHISVDLRFSYGNQKYRGNSNYETQSLLYGIGFQYYLK